MASVLLYLALSACATTAVGVFAGPQTWESWSERDHETTCHRGTQADVYAPGLVVRSDSRSGCHRHECTTDATGARKCDH